ncbi:MAG TPA: hypothetical protein PK733_03830 [Clostridiales bacterium]|nr:hypothetical protein [Clostridiales bacterium]
MYIAKVIYIAIAVLTILPLIAFNIKRFTVKREGENPRPNIVIIILTLGGSILLGVFLFSLYKFTLDYQPQLVLERFIRSYSSTAAGKIDYEKFLKETESICTPEFLSLKDRCYREIEADRQAGLGTVSFQLGETILPKYYFDKEFFPNVEGIKQNDKQPIYMLSMIEYGETRKFYITLLRIQGNKWYVDSFNEASKELAEYAYRYNFMKSEHANKWFKVKK